MKTHAQQYKNRWWIFPLKTSVGEKLSYKLSRKWKAWPRSTNQTTSFSSWVMFIAKVDLPLSKEPLTSQTAYNPVCCTVIRHGRRVSSNGQNLSAPLQYMFSLRIASKYLNKFSINITHLSHRNSSTFLKYDHMNDIWSSTLKQQIWALLYSYWLLCIRKCKRTETINILLRY